MLDPASISAPAPVSDPASVLVVRLLARAERRAVGASVSRIIAVTDREDAAIGVLAEVLLGDAYIAARVVRLANSVLHNRTGARVSSLPEAIAIIGVENIRLIALSAVLLEEFAGHRQRARLRQELARGLYASLLAAELARPRLQRRQQEEAALATLLRGCGRLLCAAYAWELRERIDELQQAQSLTEDLAAQSVLGISLEELTARLLRRWGMSDRLIFATASCPGRQSASADIVRNLRMIAAFADEVGGALVAGDPGPRLARVRAALDRFAAALDLNSERLGLALYEVDRRASEATDVLRLQTGVEAGAWLVGQLDPRIPAGGDDGPPIA